jgi:hypothetical protein
MNAHTLPVSILRLEGLLVLLSGVYAYTLLQASWVLFFLFLLVPDLSIAGYLVNRRVGAAIYNIGHSYVVPFSIVIVSWATDNVAGVHIALIWFCHIGMDRFFGLGLKQMTGFRDTHLGRIGKM